MDLSPAGKTTISSTPVTHLTRKRKLNETLELTSSPNFSSTLNESLLAQLQDIRLINSLPATPEKRSVFSVVSSSPIQESRQILYGNLKVRRPERERKLLFCKGDAAHGCHKLLPRVFNNMEIMDVIFKYLSGGDLYRFSSVSQMCCKALESNRRAFARFQVYKLHYKDNKENYVITPPGSPEKADSPPRTTSEKFNKCIRVASMINNTSQSLLKCRKCGHVAIVESEIAQCQSISCGLIYCLRCPSTSETGAKDFKDACGHASLRPLGNIDSNRMLEDSYFNFSSQDSGFYSENESPPKVKRNLFRTNGTPKALSVRNKQLPRALSKRRDSITYVPVVTTKEEVRKPLDGDSPPRYGYAVCSKQSKKNLKRLTR